MLVYYQCYHYYYYHQQHYHMYRLGLETAEEQMSTFVGSSRKQRNSRKSSTSASLTTLKHLVVWITTNCAKFLKRPEYQILYESEEATVRTRHGTMDWFKIGKGLCQGHILSPLFSLHAEYFMQNAGLDDSQAGIKIARKNINILRFAHDTTQMAKHKEELKSLLKRMKEESEKAGLKLNNIQETKIMTSVPMILLQIEGGKVDIVTHFIFLGSKFTAGGDCSHEIKRLFLLGRKAMPNSDKLI